MSTDPSDPPEVKTERIRYEAYTDWFGILVVGVLVAIGRASEDWLWLVGAIAAPTAVARWLGKRVTATGLLMGPIGKLLAAIIGTGKIS